MAVLGSEDLGLGVALIEGPVLQYCGEADGDYVLVMSRKMNAPDIDKDMQFAFTVQAIRAQKAQANVAQSPAFAVLLSEAKFSQLTPMPSFAPPTGSAILWKQIAVIPSLLSKTPGIDASTRFPNPATQYGKQGFGGRSTYDQEIWCRNIRSDV
ncbi:MAG: hypothetical protein KC592_06325 [Nitrospira sp.]|nr:hypothetical protein [Nitrospira sp.]